MKFKLQLKTVINIQRDIEEHIRQYEDSIISNNTEVDVSVLVDTMTKLHDQLITVKEVIQSANKAKNSEKKTNNYFIYKKANLERLKKFYNRLKSSIGTRDEDASLNKTTIDEKKKTIESEIKVISQKLTTFNDSKTVSIQIEDSLVRLFPILQDG